MKERITTIQWLDVAVSGIKFGPDRRAVREELEAHIEEKVADLKRIFPDIPTQEAADRALSGMGDLEELKVALAKIHKPWLGWLWRVSQVLLTLAVFVVLVTGNGPDIWGIWSSEGPGPERPELVTLETDKTRVKTDGFTITMTEAYRYIHYYPEGEPERRLIVTLRRTSPMFWCRGSDIGSSWNTFLSAEDSLGNCYPSYYERWNGKDGGSTWEFVWANGRDEGLFHTDYEFMIPLKDPSAEWLRLDYDWMGRSFSVRVNLKEAGV